MKIHQDLTLRNRNRSQWKLIQQKIECQAYMIYRSLDSGFELPVLHVPLLLFHSASLPHLASEAVHPLPRSLAFMHQPPACEENHIRLAELHEILLLELCKDGGLPLLLPFALYVPAVKDHDRESCCLDLVQPMET